MVGTRAVGHPVVELNDGNDVLIKKCTLHNDVEENIGSYYGWDNDFNRVWSASATKPDALSVLVG